MEKCMYCQQPLKDYGHNPDDFGLHSKHIKFHKYRTCDTCNKVITITNRLLKNAIDTNFSKMSIAQLQAHIESLGNINV